MSTATADKPEVKPGPAAPPEQPKAAAKTPPDAHKVKATREGLMGGKTASGYMVDPYVPFVALPSWNALGKFIRISNPLNGKNCIAIVLEVGPWNEKDDAYVFGSARPASELGRDTRGRVTNQAGIDLGQKVWHDLGMVDNTDVVWQFLAE